MKERDTGVSRSDIKVIDLLITGDDGIVDAGDERAGEASKYSQRHDFPLDWKSRLLCYPGGQGRRG